MDNGTAQIVTYEGAIWFGVHFALTCATYAQWILIYFADFLRIVVTKLKFQNRLRGSFSDDAKRLSKLPKHLAILLETDAGLEDLVNVVLWSFLLGTPFVTVHSRKGFSQSLFQEFIKKCERKKKELGEEQILINYHEDSRLCSESVRGNHFMISSASKDREKLVDISRNICKLVKEGTTAIEDIDSGYINTAHGEGFPDPDLAVSFSSYPSLHGLNPWATRLTEIITVSSYKGIDYSSFLNILKQFAGTKQRLGK